MSRIPPGLARRIDRLARHAHRFHRFAHHPLCGAYAGEVVRLGRRFRLCRGCTLVVVGAAAGAAAGLTAPPLPALALPAGVLLLAIWAALALARRAGRPWSKWITRAGPAALAAFLVGAGLRAGLGSGSAWSASFTVVAVTAALVALGFIRYRSRGPDRTACAGCPQAPPGPRCDGFREMARRERAFSRLASRWIDRDATGPCQAGPP